MKLEAEPTMVGRRWVVVGFVWSFVEFVEAEDGVNWMVYYIN
jgi:hypothetical protein